MQLNSIRYINIVRYPISFHFNSVEYQYDVWKFYERIKADGMRRCELMM